MRRTENAKFGAWLLLSLGLHVVAGVIYFLLATRPFITNERHVIAVNIVQKGKVRDENLLPTLPAQEVAPEVQKPQAPPVEPQKTEPVSPKAEIHHLKKEKPVIAKHQKGKEKSALETLQSRLKKLDRQGNEQAPDFGNSVTGELSDAYEARVQALLYQTFVIPRFISETLARRLMVRVRLKIGADGQPLLVEVTKASKSADYDNAVVANAKSIESFGPPPLPLRKKLQREGLEIELCPYRCPDKE